MPRIFTGLELPLDVAQSLATLRGGLPGARWIDPEDYHVTLRFIGDVDDTLAREVALLLGKVSRPPLELRLDGLSSFGGRRPRAVIATLAQTPALMELQAERSSRACTSSNAVAKPWVSATISCATGIGVGCAAATSPTTLPKSNRSSASNLLASCCIRSLSARQAICRNVMPRLRAASRVRASSAEPTPWLCHGSSMLKAASASRAVDAPIGRSSAAPRIVPFTKKPWMTVSMLVAKLAYSARNSSDTSPPKRLRRLAGSSRSKCSR